MRVVDQVLAPPPPSAARARSLRIGTRERDQAVAVLQAHYVAGRLTSAELSERVELALAARTAADLDALLADLPPVAPAPAPETPSADRLTGREARRRRRHGCGRHGRGSFRAHATSYLLVMALLVTIWLLTTPGGYFWPVWPMLGWGIGLASHGLAARAVRSSEGD